MKMHNKINKFEDFKYTYDNISIVYLNSKKFVEFCLINKSFKTLGFRKLRVAKIIKLFIKA